MKRKYIPQNKQRTSTPRSLFITRATVFLPSSCSMLRWCSTSKNEAQTQREPLGIDKSVTCAHERIKKPRSLYNLLLLFSSQSKYQLAVIRQSAWLSIDLSIHHDHATIQHHPRTLLRTQHSLNRYFLTGHAAISNIDNEI
jgi:hypothetical protein